MKNTILKHTLFLIITLSIIFSFAITSCGGGGGGGGGGTAAGPAPSSTDNSSSGSSSSPAAAPAPVPSALAEITSFSFTQADNATLNADLNGNPQTVNDAASVQVYYAFNSQQNEDFENLKPVIEISEGATISPNPDETQNFTSNVVYTVTAEDGTTSKEWTVSVLETNPTERTITYDPDGGSINCNAPGVFNVEQGMSRLPDGGNITKPNCYFAGWIEESNGGQLVSGWGANQRQNDVSLRAYWKPAPYIEGHNIYANGIPVYVKNDGGKTMVSFYDDETNEEIKLSDINATADYQNLTGYTLYAGDSGNTNASGIPPTDGSITMLGGTLSNIYGYNRDGTNLVGNVTIDIRGGTVSTDVVGFNSGTSNQPANAVLTVSGNSTVGDKHDNGVWLNSLTSQIVTINGSISSNAEAITLIANHSNISEDTIVATFNNGTADAGKFKLLRDDTHETVNVNAYGSNIITIGSFGLPERITWIGENEFTLGTGNINSGGTIFSVFADGGFLTVTDTDLPGANFDMGIPIDDSTYLENGYDDTLYANKKYRYIQFTSESGNITAQNADNYLSNIHFYTINRSSVKVRINLETVPISGTDPATGTSYTLNQDVFYLDGSFYKKSARFNTGGKSWPEAYNEAKAQTFNGLQGYLMTITSDAENKFIYDQVFKGMAADNVGSWIGGTRIKPRNGYDATTWGWDETSLNSSGKATCWNANEVNDYWAWACGPEAGKVFYTKAKYVEGQNYRAPGMYSSWSNKKDCALNGIEYHYTDDVEPNNGGKNPATERQEYYTQYTGRYVWNDGHEKGNGYSTGQGRWQIHYYIVEFTPYEATQYGPGQRALKTALHAEREYHRN
ncbi:MAG: hypothetical protein J6T84_03600 [Spirochaetaceae bacterium]|nr:hypothetical protein [Spirochaetaceae bacterium]